MPESRWKIVKRSYRPGGLIGKKREGFFVVNRNNPQHVYGPYETIEAARAAKATREGYDG